MTVLTLVTALALGFAAADPAALVQKLGSSKTAEREAAAAALEALGREALPALRTARESRDAGIRDRAAAVREKIETALLIRPTLVSLDFQERPISEVVKAIGGQTGFRLALEPANDPAWQGQRVTLREPNPLPFWEMLDRLGAVGQVRHDPGIRPSPGDRVPVFRLKAGSSSFPKSFSGPFRVNLVSIHRGHEVAFGPEEGADDGEEEEPDVERFEVQVQVFAEPHLMIGLNGPPKELKARDDFDQDLVPPPPEPSDDMDAPDDAPMPVIERGDGRLPGALSIVQLPIALKAPDRPGTTIERLEWFIPLRVATRRPDPLVVNLAAASGKTFKNDEVTLKFPDGPLQRSPRAAIGVFVKPANKPDLPAAETEPPPPDFPAPRPVDTLQNRIEILDREGRPLYWTLRDREPTEEGDVRVTLVLSIRNGNAEPAELRYYGLTHAAVEVPFKFAKIPMP